jgi:hypothetical protein
MCFPQKEADAAALQRRHSLSPAKRAKADKRNARLREKRAADLAAGGGAKSGKKQKKMTDLTEEEMPASGGGSSSSATNTQLLVAELLTSQTNLARLESKEQGLAEEAARFYEGHVKLLERSNAEKKN